MLTRVRRSIVLMAASASCENQSDVPELLLGNALRERRRCELEMAFSFFHRTTKDPLQSTQQTSAKPKKFRSTLNFLFSSLRFRSSRLYHAQFSSLFAQNPHHPATDLKAEWRRLCLPTQSRSTEHLSPRFRNWKQKKFSMTKTRARTIIWERDRHTEIERERRKNARDTEWKISAAILLCNASTKEFFNKPTNTNCFAR